VSSSSALVARWFVVGVALLLAAGPILSAFTILALLAAVGVLAVYAAATAVVLNSLVRQALATRTRRSRGVVCAVPVLLVVLVFGSYAIISIGNRAFGYARFALLYPVYSRIVSGLGESPPNERTGHYGFVRYEVDSGPPVRVVFPHFGGIADNWAGTVYDPSDEVATATGWKYAGGTRDFSAPANIRKLFGGDVVSCRRLWGHYFLCSFT
jgi:hypothetical protein